MTHSNPTPYEQGKQAYKDGKPLDFNPYRFSKASNGKLWSCGWFDARDTKIASDLINKQVS